MLVDGKKIANEIKESLRQEVVKLGRVPVLSIIYVGSDPAIESFIKIKKRFGEEMGVQIEIHRFGQKISGEELKKEIEKISGQSDGVIVQLPLSQHLDTDSILNAIPLEKDVDVLSKKAMEMFEKGDSAVFPPVAGAIKEIFDRYNVDMRSKKIVIIGKGRLVGQPTISWLKREGIEPVALEEGDDVEREIRDADIIISGAGSPGLIKLEMIKEGVIIIDAGTSESKGKICGDADPACADKASVFTPVPGGIGPMTVAILFRNLITLLKNNQ